MHNLKEKIIKESIKKDISSRDDFLRLLKDNLRGTKHSFPTTYELRKTYDRLLGEKRIKRSPSLEKVLISRRVRTISGVTVITVVTKPWPCPGDCLYCPTEKGVPKSYLSNEPAIQRAILTEYDPKKQIKARLRSLKYEGHSTEKVELIVVGGTFSFLPKDYQESFIKHCFDGLNGSESKDLEEAKKVNETSQNRCVGLTLETRPDYINKKEIKWMRYLGATRVELGVQSVFDDVLSKNKRGHGINKVIEATKLLKDAGFKICYHLMPNLYGSNLEKDQEMFEKVFFDQRFKPDYIKIYPAMVIKGSDLYNLWKEGKYYPYSEKELEDLLVDAKEKVPYWLRIMRLIRDVPTPSVEAGIKVSNFRQRVQESLKAKGTRCDCIRCREIGHKDFEYNGEIKLFREEYEASRGKEFFLSFEDEKRENLFALLRLRFPNNTFVDELKNCAIIREVHTYGLQANLGKKGEHQHKGLGKKLIKKAEMIAKDSGYNKIAVISGVGVRDYYKALGYSLSGEYMIKKI